MKSQAGLLVVLCVSVAIGVAVAAPPPAQPAVAKTATVKPVATLRTIDWMELMPPEDIKALEAAPELNHNGLGVADGYMKSAKTVAKMAGARGRIAGYVVPITLDSKERVLDMFFVPYFGACLHMPPPPPNQIIYIKPKMPQKIGDIWEPYWAVGTLRINRSPHPMADSAYEIELEKLELWES